MRLTFYGGAGSVTGANYLLEIKDSSQPHGVRKILIDCGLHQGGRFVEDHNYQPFSYKPSEISAVFVTHAHIDHTGRLPKLLKDGFQGTVYSTPPTRDFAKLLLLDSEHILAQDADHQHKPRLYSVNDIEHLMKQWVGIPYHQTIPLRTPGHPPVGEVTLYSAGHILGSATIVVRAEGKTIVFSGDLGNSPAPLIGPSECPTDADYCVMESAYGDRNHESLADRKEKLERVITETIHAGGCLMVPAFALERTQILLLELQDLFLKHKIPTVPTFIDSPLAIKLTTVYNLYCDYFRPELASRCSNLEDMFRFPGLHMTPTTEDSKATAQVSNPKIVIAGAGMSQAGRILHHEKLYLPDPKSTLLIFGYQASGSLGRQLLDGAKTVRILGEDVAVRAKVKAIGAYSAHADQRQLLEWLKPLAPKVKEVFLVQGEDNAAHVLADKIKEAYGVNTLVPTEGSSVVL
jgi:metallo-beta-lactamase family protein